MSNNTDNNEYVDASIMISDTVNGIPIIELSKDDMIKVVTEQYLADIDPDTGVDLMRLKAALIDLVYSFIQLRNQAGHCQKWRGRETLYPQQIAMAMQKLYHIVQINMAGAETEMDPKYTVLGIYQESGDNEGIYITNDKMIINIIYNFNRDISKKERDEVIEILQASCETVRRCEDPDLLPLQNGIFNYKTKQCMPFSPDYVFTAKCKVKYNACAVNPIIHNDEDGTDWDVESWMADLFEDEPEVVTTLWQVIGATIRPNVPWNKAIWMLSTRGNNGKGTLCELIRNLVGRGSYTSIKLTDFGKDFALEPLVHCTSIITDENDVGTYIDQAANLKAIITGDTIQINRKFMSAVAYQFRGLMIQCINEVPKIRDRSESFYRRQLIIKFKKSYTGIERKYIKEDYLNRPEVLEYVLYKVLNMDYYEINEPEYCKETMNLYKIHNDPVRDFMNETMPQFGADAIPSEYLYVLYGKWLEQNNPAAKKFMLGKTNFLAEFKELLANYPEWYFPKDHFRVKAKYLDKQELTLHIYDLKEWMTDPNSSDPNVRYKLKWEQPFMRGILRVKHKPTKLGRPANEPEEDKNETEDAPASASTDYGEVKNNNGEVINVENV